MSRAYPYVTTCDNLRPLCERVRYGNLCHVTRAQHVIGERVKFRRMKLGLTQEQLGKKARPRVTREQITKIERGRVGVGESVGRRLARVLVLDGETFEDVYRELVAPPPPNWTQRVEALEEELAELRLELRRLQGSS